MATYRAAGFEVAAPVVEISLEQDGEDVNIMASIGGSAPQTIAYFDGRGRLNLMGLTAEEKAVFANDGKYLTTEES